MRATCTILAALLLACAGCARSADEWRAGLHDADPFPRGLSALGLARVAPADCGDAIPVLLELVDAPERELHEAARTELARVARFHVPQLVANLVGVEDASSDFRSALRDALVAAGPEAVGPLRAHLLDGGASNPRVLGQMLADIGPSAVAPLVADLADPDLRRRVCTAWTLARLGPRARSAAPTLAELVARDDAPVARQAALALAEVAPLDETTRAVLESALARRGPELGGALREALARLALNRARLGASEPTDSLLFVLGAEAFVPAAEEVSPRSAGERCLRLRYAALALGLEPLAGAPQREPARLQSMLDDRDPGTRALAAFEIAALGERAEGFVAPLAARCFDGHGGAALSARLALLHVLRCLALERARSRP